MWCTGKSLNFSQTLSISSLQTFDQICEVSLFAVNKKIQFDKDTRLAIMEGPCIVLTLLMFGAAFMMNDTPLPEILKRAITAMSVTVLTDRSWSAAIANGRCKYIYMSAAISS